MLNEQEKIRYSRHLLLDKIGVEGQEKLKSSKVLVIGAGGLGCPVLQYLSAAGVGTIGIIDFDTVDESNLHRQILFNSEDVGKNKASVAKNKLQKQNQHLSINSYPEKLTSKNALSLFKNYDVVVDGTDNFSTRYLVNDACVITDKPLVYGSIYKFEGQVTVFNYLNGPTYRCLFPEPPLIGSIPNCAEVGVLGALPGVIGTLQATEVIKIILGIGSVLSGKLLIYNLLTSVLTNLKIKSNPAQIKKTKALETNFSEFNYDVFCGIAQNNSINQSELKELLQKENIQIVDVREEWELPKIINTNVINAPLNQLEQYISHISKNKKVVVVCQKGIRSLHAIKLLSSKYGYKNLLNLEEGLNNWKNE